MTRPARPTSSASTPSSSCNIAGGSSEPEGSRAGPDVRRDLFEAMQQIAETGQGPRDADAIDRLLDQVEGRLGR